MLTINIPSVRLWDDVNEKFVYTTATTISLEHSLLSVSKWESIYNKPFFSKKEKTAEEIFQYIKCMTLTKNISDETLSYLSKENVKEILEYIKAPMTATTVVSNNKSHNRKIVTSEVIYYWMIALGIPFECQKWHLNRLMTLIEVCNEENRPKKKLSMNQAYKRHSAINAANKSKFHTKG